MSPFFVKKFKSITECKVCKKDKVSGYGMCPNHLEKARDAFRSWAKDRRAVGRCILCDRRGRRTAFYHHTRAPGQRMLRCGVHAEINKKRCAAWIAKHPNHAHEVWELKKKLRDKGFCPVCPQHRPLDEDFKRCKPCRESKRTRGARVSMDLLLGQASV